jgi:predicted nuclease of predicted toxin-antitoxin system
MKFLLDMGLSRRTAEFLRDHGHDAIHLRDQGLQRLSDERIVEKAIDERRVVLTHDLDFGRIVALSQGRLPSVITFRLTDMRTAEVNRRPKDVLSRFASTLEEGALISVTDNAVRIRRLPVGKSAS